MKKKIVFLGSKPIGYSCFEYLLSQANVLGFEVAGLLTQARKEFAGTGDLAALARQHPIPVLNSLDDLPECDIIYSVQYHELLKPGHIARARQIAVNLHMAPLPEYRGSNQFSYAIIEDKKEFGTTLHIIDSRIDHGDILFETRFPIPENCWVNDLYLLSFDASLELFKTSLPDVVNGAYQAIPQASRENSLGSSLHFRKEISSLKQIDLNWDKEKIERHIRATSMPGFEPPYCLVNGQKIYFSVEYK